MSQCSAEVESACNARSVVTSLHARVMTECFIACKPAKALSIFYRCNSVEQLPLALGSYEWAIIPPDFKFVNRLGK